MKVSTLIGQIRLELDDNPPPGVTPLWSDSELAFYLQEAQVKLCRDTHILKDSGDKGGTPASSVITLTGASGSISSVVLNGVTITTAAVSFNSTLHQTAVDLAASINTKGLYSAVAGSGATITVSALTGVGEAANGYVVTVNCVTMAGTAPAMSGGLNSIGYLTISVDTSSFTLHPKVIGIDSLHLTNQVPVTKVTEHWLDTNNPHWREQTSGTPSLYLVDGDMGILRIMPPSDTATTATMTVFREPLSCTINDDGSPNSNLTLEIPDYAIRALRYWVAYCAYSKNDAETLNVGKIDRFLSLYDHEISYIQREIRRTREADTGVAFHPGYL